MEEIIIYKFQLEAINEALRITANIHDSRNSKKVGQTCHDRQVRQAEKYAQNVVDLELSLVLALNVKGR